MPRRWTGTRFEGTLGEGEEAPLLDLGQRGDYLSPHGRVRPEITFSRNAPELDWASVTLPTEFVP